MAKLGLTLRGVQSLIGEGEILGDADFQCESVASLELAGPEDLSFVKSGRFAEKACQSSAGALLVPIELDGYAGHQLVVEHPHLALARVLADLAQRRRGVPSGIDLRAVVYDGAELGEDVSVGAGAVIREQARIGDRSVIFPNAYVGQRTIVGSDCVLHPNVVILEDVEIGNRVVIWGGAVIGTEGYGFIQHEGRHLRVPQVGSIQIGDDVEIGALATIDRATVDATEIGRGTKIGDCVHVAHNCAVGEDVLLAPTSMLSGSVTVGDHAVLAGHAGTSDNVKVGEGAVIGGAAVAFQDVAAGASVWGVPARDKRLELRIQAALPHLPQMARDWRRGKDPADL